MRILFMGTPEFAAVSLEHIISAGYIPVGIVTQPDRPKGRGMELQTSEVKTLALQHNLPIWQPEQIDTPEFIDFFRQLQPDLVVVVAFGQKVPAPILFEPQYGCLNVHGSLLPKYRGAAPIMWSLLNGDSVTGVTTMYMDEGWDTGDLIYQATLDVDPSENFAGLYQKLAQLGGELLVKTINDIAAGNAPRIKQDSTQASTAPKLKIGQQKINWKDPAHTIHNLVRGLAPAPGAETNLNQERLKILETKLIPSEAIYDPVLPGTIVKVVKQQGLLTATGDRPLLITRLQPPGKKVMSAFEYANGKRLMAGMSLN